MEEAPPQRYREDRLDLSCRKCCHPKLISGKPASPLINEQEELLIDALQRQGFDSLRDYELQKYGRTFLSHCKW